jgi:hypothetical protein
MIGFLRSLICKDASKPNASLSKPLGKCGRCAFFTGYECDNGPEQGKKKESFSKGCEWYCKM